MTLDEYNELFHKKQLNLVAFKRLMDCDQEVLRLVNAAIQAEREACAKVAEDMLRFYTQAVTGVPQAIRARGQE
jgi:hypothetical protein